MERENRGCRISARVAGYTVAATLAIGILSGELAGCKPNPGPVTSNRDNSLSGIELLESIHKDMERINKNLKEGSRKINAAMQLHKQVQ